MVAARAAISAPTAAPVPYGLLAAASVVDSTDPHIGLGVQYQTANCGRPHRTASECVTGDPAADLDYDDGLTVVTADPFEVYAFHRCRNLAGGNANAKQIAEAKLARGDYIAIEDAAAELVLPAAVDITPTPGTAVRPTIGLGLLEKYAAGSYAALPLLHGDRLLAELLVSSTSISARGGNRLESGLGTPFAAYSGTYPDDQAVGDDDTVAGAGEHWLWITGQMTVTRGPVSTSDPVLIKAADEQEYSNEVGVLASRTVAVAYECIAAAVLIGESA